MKTPLQNYWKKQHKIVLISLLIPYCKIRREKISLINIESYKSLHTHAYFTKLLNSKKSQYKNLNDVLFKSDSE